MEHIKIKLTIPSGIAIDIEGASACDGLLGFSKFMGSTPWLEVDHGGR